MGRGTRHARPNIVDTSPVLCEWDMLALAVDAAAAAAIELLFVEILYFDE